MWEDQGSACFAAVFNDFRQTNYLNIYQTDLHQICRVGRTMAVDERPEVSFFDLSKDVAVATNFLSQMQAHITQFGTRDIR